MPIYVDSLFRLVWSPVTACYSLRQEPSILFGGRLTVWHVGWAKNGQSRFCCHRFYLYYLGYSRSPALHLCQVQQYGTDATQLRPPPPLTTSTHTRWRRRLSTPTTMAANNDNTNIGCGCSCQCGQQQRLWRRQQQLLSTPTTTAANDNNTNNGCCWCGRRVDDDHCQRLWRQQLLQILSTLSTKTHTLVCFQGPIRIHKTRPVWVCFLCSVMFFYTLLSPYTFYQSNVVKMAIFYS